MRSGITLNKSSHLCIAILIMLMIAGCSGLKVKLVGEYDDILDSSVHQIESNTTAHIRKILDTEGAGEGSYDQSMRFYADTSGEVQALIIRAEVLEEGLKRTPLTKNFKMLQQQYDDLAELHQMPFNKDVIESAQEAFDQSFRAIVKHLIYLKWNQEQP